MLMARTRCRKVSIHTPIFSSISSSRYGRLFSCSSRNVIERAAVDGELRVFIVAGEVSGDSIASRLMTAIKELSPVPVRFAGVGGALMQKAGLQSLFPMEDITVMGIWELLPHLNKIRKNLNKITSCAFCFLPHVVVTIDAKGFSFRFLKQLREKYNQQGVSSPVHVHYVAPSFWAWKGGEARLRGLCKFVDHVLCILPFEEDICRQNGLAATFTGHPFLEDVPTPHSVLNPMMQTIMWKGNAEHFLCKHGLDSESTVITLLPGSRLQEVTRMLPIFLNTTELLKDYFSKLTAIIPVAPNHHVEAYIDKTVQKASLSVTLISGASLSDKYNAFSASRAALCTSGTAVMELQLARLPCVVAYRAHFLTEWVIRSRSKLPFICLPNILLNSAAIPEVLFNACTSENLYKQLKNVICDVSARDKQIDAAEKVLRILCRPINSGCSTPSEARSILANRRPSLIAASTILNVAKNI